jgi:glycosyltransferase involved in cell wall biosynthesis
VTIKHIGLLGFAGKNWMGGVHYVTNLIKALHALPASERPHMTLFRLGKHSSSDVYDEVEPLVQETHIVRIPTNFRRRWWHKLTRTHNDSWLNKPARWSGVQLVFPTMTPFHFLFDVPWIAWVPDFQDKYYPQYFTAEELHSRDTYRGDLARRAPLIVVSSHVARADLEKYHPEAHGRIEVMHFRTFPDASNRTGDPAAMRAKYNVPEKFLLIANQFWMHKNHLMVFKAIQQVRAELPDLKVICTGSLEDYRNPAYIGEVQQFLRDNALEDTIRILGILPADEQRQLFRAAAAVIQPSLFEGWSSIVEESRLFGKKAYLSDIGVHREQALPDALYFDPHQPEALAALLRETWADLPPGPDLQREAETFANQLILVQDYARQFLQIAERGVKSFTPPPTLLEAVRQRLTRR